MLQEYCIFATGKQLCPIISHQRSTYYIHHIISNILAEIIMGVISSMIVAANYLLWAGNHGDSSNMTSI